MRARSLKPSLFKNELLAVADPLYTLVFTGLWCLADREGRLEDRPARIHFDVNPGRSIDGTIAALDWLTANGFLVRYEVGGIRLVQVVNFLKHQNPHPREVASVIPANGEEQPRCVQGIAKELPRHSDSGLRTPDPPFSDSGLRTPDSLRSSSVGSFRPSSSERRDRTVLKNGVENAVAGAAESFGRVPR